MRRGSLRFWLIPLVVAGISAGVGVNTHLEQERQLAEVKSLYQSHAGFVGNLVRASAQQAAWSTELVYAMSATAIGDQLALLGTPAAETDCSAVLGEGDVVVWAARDGSVLRGCFGPVPAAEHGAFVDAVASSPEPGFVDTVLTRRYGVYCAADVDGARATIACRDRQSLDEMRRQIGLGPLLSALKDRELDYVVVQDAGGILAASPHPGVISSWAEDPVLQAVLDGPVDLVQARVLERDAAPVYEVASTIELGDGSHAVVRTGLEASVLASLARRIEHRQWVMSLVLSTLVLMSLILAWILGGADARRREHAAANRRRDEDLRHWQALGQMAATVAHEVRNPLNTIGMALQRLGGEFQVGEKDEPEYRDLLRLSMDAAGRVERVVTDFLELGKPLVLDRRPYPASALLEEILAPLRMRAEVEAKGIQVSSDCPGQVEVDRHRVGQILTNLVANALDAVDRGGCVTVEAACERDGLRMHVSDDGPGMDAATLARVQEAFVTTKANGTGLGLPLARILTEAHGGTLSLESTPGRGTRATVWLPRREAR